MIFRVGDWTELSFAFWLPKKINKFVTFFLRFMLRLQGLDYAAVLVPKQWKHSIVLLWLFYLIQFVLFLFSQLHSVYIEVSAAEDKVVLHIAVRLIVKDFSAYELTHFLDLTVTRHKRVDVELVVALKVARLSVQTDHVKMLSSDWWQVDLGV